MKYSSFLDRRQNTFERTYDLVLQNINSNKTYNIVELGTSRSFVSGNHLGCCSTDTKYWYPNNPLLWDWGAGIFTKVFSDNLQNYNYKLYTVDPDPSANSIVKTIIGNNPKVDIIQDYSTNFLNNIDFTIDLLYMDHMESSESACLQHLEDSKILIEKNLMAPNSIILIDDTPINASAEESKGKYSIPYLLNNHYIKLIHEYQALLIKNPTV